MDHSQNDILISAYLDGELTGEERAHVEQLLASNAEARQLLDELRSLRTSLAGLPKHHLETSLASEVVRIATQQLQAENSPIKAATLPMSRGDNVVEPPRSIWSTWRGIAWAAVALAAALLIFVTNYGKNENAQQIAFQRESAREASEISSADRSSTKKSGPELDSATLTADEPKLTKSPRGALGSAFDDYSIQSKPAITSGKSLSGFNADSPEGGRFASSSSAASSLGLPLSGPSDDVVVVRVDLTREAAKSKAFEEILTQNKIAISTTDLNRSSTEGIQSGSDRSQALTESLEVLVVEASADQLDAALNKLKASPSMFRSVVIAEPHVLDKSSELYDSARGAAANVPLAPSSGEQKKAELRKSENAKLMEMSEQAVVPPSSAAPSGRMNLSTNPAPGSPRFSPAKPAETAVEKRLQGGRKPVKAVFVLRIIDAAPEMGVEK